MTEPTGTPENDHVGRQATTGRESSGEAMAGDPDLQAGHLDELLDRGNDGVPTRHDSAPEG